MVDRVGERQEDWMSWGMVSSRNKSQWIRVAGEVDGIGE